MIYSNWHQTTATQFSGVCHLTMFEKKREGGGGMGVGGGDVSMFKCKPTFFFSQTGSPM